MRVIPCRTTRLPICIPSLLSPWLRARQRKMRDTGLTSLQVGCQPAENTPSPRSNCRCPKKRDHLTGRRCALDVHSLHIQRPEQSAALRCRPPKDDATDCISGSCVRFCRLASTVQWIPDMLYEMSTLSFALWTAARRFVRMLPAPAGFAGRRVGLLVGHSLVFGTVIASTPAAAQPAGDVIPEHELRTHHIGFQMGLLDPSTEIVELGNPGLDVEGNRFLAVLNYRYSLNSFVDLTGDLRSWGGPWTTPASQHVKLGVYLVGPGMRLYGLNRTTDRRVMPWPRTSEPAAMTSMICRDSVSPWESTSVFDATTWAVPEARCLSGCNPRSPRLRRTAASPGTDRWPPSGTPPTR